MPILIALLLSFALSFADTYSWGNVTFEGGGFVSGVFPSKTQAGLVYARTDVGGAYRWDSLGGKWIPLMDWVSEADRGFYGTEALALDPNDSRRVFLLAGMTYFSEGKTAILRSFDYGETFDVVDVTAQFKAHGNGMGRQTGEKLAFDPQNSAILFCGTRTQGLFRSADTGKTWTPVPGTTALGGSSMVNDNGISFVLFDTTSGLAPNGGTKDVYLGVAKSSVSSLYRSTDGGVTFAAVAGSPSQMALRAIIVQGVLYGTFSAGPGPHSQHGGSVWKYTLATGAWAQITPRKEDGNYFAGGSDTYGYSFGGISVDPQNPACFVLTTEAYYGGNNTWPDGKNNAGDAIFLSEDGTATWRQVNPWGAATPTVHPNGNNWISGSSIHWAGSIEFDPFSPNRVWVTSGNGMFRTDDISAAVPLWKFQSKGIEETVPMEAISVPGGPLVTAILDYDGATYDNITSSVPVHNNPIGSSNSLGYGALVGAFLRSGRVTDYSTTPAVTYDVLYHSTDSGRTWTATDTSTVPGSGGTLAMSADGRVFLMRPVNLRNGSGASSATFYRSADGGSTWTPVAGLSTQNGRMVSDPVNPARFYIYPDGYQGDFYASSDTGKTFTRISSLANNGLGQYTASSGMLRAAPGAEGDLWVCLDAEQPWNASGYSSNGLAHSTDGGATWRRINTMDACLTMGLGLAAPGADYHTLYMWGAANGGGRGIYRSTDKGQTWLRINDDRHQYGGPANGNFVVGDFNVYGRVYMSTAGRGLVYGNIGELTTPIGGLSTQTPRLIAVDMVQHGSNLRITSRGLTRGRLQIFDLRGRQLMDQVVADGIQNISLSSLGSGSYVARLSADQGSTVGKALRLHSATEGR